MSEWKEIALGEIVDFTTGKLNSNAATNNGKYPFFTCSPETLRIDSYAFDCQAILLAGNNANAIYPIKIYSGKFNAYQRTYVITLKNLSLSNLRYLYYLLTLKLNHFKEISQGSATKFLTTVILNNLQIKLPLLDEQKSIADVISCLDAKIENLRRQNETLEAIAQTLFKHWFIDFEFPDADGKPYKSSGGEMIDSAIGDIPEGWKVGKLEDFVIVINGYSYKGDELNESDTALVTLKNFDRNGGFKLNGFKELNSSNFKAQHLVKSNDLIVAHTDLTQNAEVLGNPALIQPNVKYKKYVISMDLVKIESKKEYVNNYFLYYLMSTRHFKSHCVGYSNGTTVLHLSKKAIPEYIFPVPRNSQIITQFQQVVSPVREKMTNNLAQIQTLTKTREALLPKLMSGQLRIEE